MQGKGSSDNDVTVQEVKSYGERWSYAGLDYCVVMPSPMDSSSVQNIHIDKFFFFFLLDFEALLAKIATVVVVS